MAINNSFITKIDPIQALIEYIQDIKPYHSKIVETNVEYVNTDPVNAKLTESLVVTFATSIAAVTSHSISIVGDETKNISIGSTLTVSGSISNNGSYTVTAVSFNDPNTIIVIAQTMPAPGELSGTLEFSKTIV